MSEESDRKEGKNGQDGETVGEILRKARIEADVDIHKICADLRISPQALEALEQGRYGDLPGDPYVRALLGSLGRYLRIEASALVQRYNRETGTVQAAPSIAPYKDRSSTHTSSHKQIFLVIFGVLLVVLFLLIKQLKQIEPQDGMPPAPGAAAVADTLADPSDTAVSSALAPDAGDSSGSADSVGAGGIRNPAAVPPTAGPASRKTVAEPPAKRPAVAATPAPAPASADTAASAAPTAPAAPSVLVAAVVKPLVDSVGVRVLRSGKEEFSTLLRLGKQMQVSHTDTIVVMVSKSRSVEVSIDDQTVIPNRKRFKIFGKTVKTF